MEPERISAEDVARQIDAGEPVTFLDSRAEAAWQDSDLQIPDAVRVPPDDVAAHLDEIPRTGLIVPYCT